jgi:hypothetical protein
MNPIQKIIIAKVKTLLERQELAESIDHNLTKGNLRENYLKDFIVDLIPKEYDTTTGFIASSNQDILSPQIDIIINEKVRTPKFLLCESISIIPFESVFLLIEVKTRITNEVIEQIKSQNDFIDKCGKVQLFSSLLTQDLINIHDILHIPLIDTKSLTNNYDKPKQFIITFSSDLSDDSLKGLFKLIRQLLGIWVVGKYFIYGDEGQVKKVEGDPSSLLAINRLLSCITIMNQQRSPYVTNWTKYLE